jgi:hypothetical protein
MFKKIFFSSTLIVIIALMMSGTVFAASGTPATRQVNRVGRITATGSSSLTIQTIGGQLFTVKVMPGTQYQRVSGGSPSFRDINVGQWITAIGTFDRQHVLNATTIVVMPNRINKGKWINKRAYGTVLQVIPGSKTFTLITENGRMRFTVSDSTVFTGNSVRYFGALKAGMQAVVSYTEARNGSLTVQSIGAY